MARFQTDTIHQLTGSRRASSPTPTSSTSRLNTMSSDAPGPSQARGEGANSQVEPVSLAPRPCERCARTSKPCRGPPGARCEHCKRLKQKCSNSSVSARGRHAVARNVSNDATQSMAAPVGYVAVAVTVETDDRFQGRSSLKRKADVEDETPSEGNSFSRDSDQENDDGHIPAKLNKKRRTALSGSMIASRVLKHVKQLEEAVKRLEDTYAQEMERMDSIVAALTKEMTDLIDDKDTSS